MRFDNIFSAALLVSSCLITPIAAQKGGKGAGGKGGGGKGGGGKGGGNAAAAAAAQQQAQQQAAQAKAQGGGNKNQGGNNNAGKGQGNGGANANLQLNPANVQDASNSVGEGADGQANSLTYARWPHLLLYPTLTTSQ